jgi:hypothetical protein
VQDPENGRWVSLSEASDALDIPLDTLRRRARRGDVVARQVPTRQGFRWEVWLAGDQPSATSDQASASQQPADRDELILTLTNQIGVLSGRVGWLEAQLQAANERVLQLEAPVVTAERNGAENAPPRRWWAFWQRPMS